MNSSTLRRLAADQASLHRSIPPNYLFSSDHNSAGLPDDLTQLSIHLTGAYGTPYAQGLWRLHLKMPEDYPKNPPKATFRTRIFHPNVEESTGAVCLDTLKKDWEPKLTLRDILITISCLLIHPNPESALNSAAGALLQDDYEAFARQARLMTSIHARIPHNLKEEVTAAQRRGEEATGGPPLKLAEDRPAPVRASSSTTSVIMKQTLMKSHAADQQKPLLQQSLSVDTSDDEEDHDEAKENDPSQSPSPVLQGPPSPRKNVLGKRPLSELPTPVDPDAIDPFELESGNGMTASEKNISANLTHQSGREVHLGPPKKSPKLSTSAQGANASGIIRVDRDEDAKRGRGTSPCPQVSGPSPEDEKENIGDMVKSRSIEPIPNTNLGQDQTAAAASARPSLRKVLNVGSTRNKGQVRVGIRRL